MYGLLWNRLPGPLPVRLLISVLLVLVVVGVLFVWGFPVLAPLMPFNDGTVSE